MNQVPVRRQQQPPTTQQALANSTDDYEKWSNDWAFVRAVRQGKVTFVVHVNTGTVRHVHIHYDGGPVPNFGDTHDW